MERMIHTLVQGSDEWHQFRAQHNGASEAAAMLGLSRHVKRNELLAAKATGATREFSQFVQERILDRGHELEALARPLAEEILAEELYPATYSYGHLSASCDGLTMDGSTAFEHKSLNAELAARVSAGELPEEYQPQCQQIMYVTGATRVLFMTSDGTRENCHYLFVESDPELQARILAGWDQFDADLADFTPVEVIPAPVAAPRMALPALSIQVNGSISLVDNLKVFGERLQEFIEGLDRNPSDDQAFADSEAAIKTLQAAQDALEAAEQNALAQTASIDEMRRTVAMYRDQARSTRLMLEKLVKARKDAIRAELVQSGKDRLAEHIATLNKMIGQAWMPPIPADFASAIKGKKTVTSIRDAVDTELARAKIEANAIANRIRINRETLRELSAGYEFLFRDEAQLVTRDEDYLAAVAKARIAEHKAAEEKRLEEERERIRAEEQAKLAREAEEKARRDEQERAEAERQARERAEQQQRERDEFTRAHAAPTPQQTIQAPAAAVVPLAAPVAQRATRTPGRPTPGGHWVAELTCDERDAFDAITDVLADRPELIGLLCINFAEVNRLASSPDFNVPGFRAVFVPEPTYGEAN